MKGADANTQDTRPGVTTHPLLRVAGVLPGTHIPTCTVRLMSVCMDDNRGALHLGVDKRPWFNTAFYASMRFIGTFFIYLGGLLGQRRVFLACACMRTVVRFLIPFWHSLEAAITLLIVASLSAGTFYPLTLSFVLRNLPMRFVLLRIAMYATDIIEIGSIFMGHVITVREEFHSNMLGLYVQLGNSLTDSRPLGLQHGFAPHSAGLTAMGRAAEVLGQQVRQQANPFAISDRFLLLATYCVAFLMVVSFMSKVPTQYRQVTAAPVEAT